LFCCKKKKREETNNWVITKVPSASKLSIEAEYVTGVKKKKIEKQRRTRTRGEDFIFWIHKAGFKQVDG